MPDSTERRRFVASAATLAIALVVAGCSSSSTTTDSPPSGSTPRASTAGSAKVDSLDALLIDHAPDGFALQPEGRSHTGPTDLAAAIRADGHTDARTALTSEGFRHGYQRLWTDPAGDLIGVQVYRFATAAGARSNYVRAGRLAAQQTQHVKRYRSGEVSGTEVDFEGNVTEQVIGISRRNVMQVVCTSRTATGLRSRALALAHSQYELMAQAT